MTTESSTERIEFQGRKVRRADSRERRRAILEAVLRIIIRDGVRGVRHRAVAKEAGVPLAATTYYFKDIPSLLADAFNLFAEDSLKEQALLEQSGMAALDKLKSANLTDPQVLELLTSALSNALLNHVKAQVADRDRRILEHSFKTEALRNPALAATACIPQEKTTHSIISFFQLLGSTDAASDAQIVHGAILFLEYQLLLGGGADLDSAHQVLRRLIGHVLRASARR